MRTTNYDKRPFVAVPDAAGACVTGWAALASARHSTAPAQQILIVGKEVFIIFPQRIDAGDHGKQCNEGNHDERNQTQAEEF